MTVYGASRTEVNRAWQRDPITNYIVTRIDLANRLARSKRIFFFSSIVKLIGLHVRVRLSATQRRLHRATTDTAPTTASNMPIDCYHEHEKH